MGAGKSRGDKKMGPIPNKVDFLIVCSFFIFDSVIILKNAGVLVNEN